MQTYSYYSRTLLIEFLQRTIFFKIWKSLNKNYFWYFSLVNKNRLFISYNSYSGVIKWYLKYENRAFKDSLLCSSRIYNNSDLESFVNCIDKSIEERNMKRWYLKVKDSDKFDLSLDINF